MSTYRRRDHKGRFTNAATKKSTGLKLVSKRKLSIVENLVFYGSIMLALVLIGFGLVLPAFIVGIIGFFLLGFVSKTEVSKAAELGIFDVYKSVSGLNRITHFDSWITGLDYHGISKVASEIKINDVLTILREPDNQYDRNAIAVWFEGIQIGYLTREFAQSFHKQMDGGDDLEVRVTQFDSQSYAYDRLRIVLIDKTYQKEIGKSIIRG